MNRSCTSGSARRSRASEPRSSSDTPITRVEMDSSLDQLVDQVGWMPMARSEYSSTTSRVTAGVTFGLPSRSPPDPAAQHERPGPLGHREPGRPHLALELAEQVGHRAAAQLLHVPADRLRLVGHRGAGPGAARRSARAARPARPAPRPVRSRSSPSATRRRIASTDCRDDSVGCAVNTGRSSARASTSCTSARNDVAGRLRRPAAPSAGAAAPRPWAPAAQLARPVPLLGDVGQLEVLGERPGQRDRGAGVQAGEQRG